MRAATPCGGRRGGGAAAAAVGIERGDDARRYAVAAAP